MPRYLNESCLAGAIDECFLFSLDIRSNGNDKERVTFKKEKAFINKKKKKKKMCHGMVLVMEYDISLSSAVRVRRIYWYGQWI